MLFPEEKLKIMTENCSLLNGPEAFPWMKDMILYEVYVRNFSHEGNFAGVINRLDQLRDLGITAIWLMPIHPIGKLGKKGTLGCPYSVADYFEINPEYGVKEDFRRLVTEVHNRRMKIIIDMVANHAANDNVNIIIHPDWFYMDESGKPTRRMIEWSDVVDQNFSNPHLWKFMKKVLLYWLQEFDIDGYRCDVAGMVPLQFWEEAVVELRKIKPDFYMLAEWDGSSHLCLKAFNSDYRGEVYRQMVNLYSEKPGKSEAEIQSGENTTNYDQLQIQEKTNSIPNLLSRQAEHISASMVPGLLITNPKRIVHKVDDLNWLNTGSGKIFSYPVKQRAQDLVDLWINISKKYPKNHINLNFIENHDQQRAVKLFGRKGYKPLAAFIFTVPGIPLIYNGQETGETRYLSLFDHQPVDWNCGDSETLEFYKELINLRKAHPTTRHGEVIPLSTDHPEEILSYLVKSQEETIVCILNLSSELLRGTLKIPNAQYFERFKSQKILPNDSSKLEKINNSYCYQIYPYGIIIAN